MLLQSVPNPDYMNGTGFLMEDFPEELMKGTLGIDVYPSPSEASRFALSRSISSQASVSMGTTGSLGVSYAAPLTRGGFKGEIFDSAPMPTGYWKDAPTPLMLGMGYDAGDTTTSTDTTPPPPPSADDKKDEGLKILGLSLGQFALIAVGVAAAVYYTKS
jgi:hypothetical protein